MSRKPICVNCGHLASAHKLRFMDGYADCRECDCACYQTLAEREAADKAKLAAAKLEGK